MNDGDATPFEGCDLFLFQYQVFVGRQYKVSEGKWRLSLGLFCITVMLLLLTVTHHAPSLAMRVISYFTISYRLKNLSAASH